MELQLALCLNEWASYLKIIRTKGEKSQGSAGNIFRVKDYFSPIGIDVYFMGKIIFWLRSYLYESLTFFTNSLFFSENLFNI